MARHLDLLFHHNPPADTQLLRDLFVGRDWELNRMSERIPGSSQLPGIRAIHGVRGIARSPMRLMVSKTDLAIGTTDLWMLPHRIEQRARAEARKGTWVERLPASKLNDTPGVRFGPIATSGQQFKLRHEPAVTDALRASDAHFLAADTFTDRLLKAMSNSPTEMMIIRGVPENSFSKDDKYEPEIAARNAASFAMELISKL